MCFAESSNLLHFLPRLLVGMQTFVSLKVCSHSKRLRRRALRHLLACMGYLLLLSNGKMVLVKYFCHSSSNVDIAVIHYLARSCPYFVGLLNDLIVTDSVVMCPLRCCPKASFQIFGFAHSSHHYWQWKVLQPYLFLCFCHEQSHRPRWTKAPCSHVQQHFLLFPPFSGFRV